MKDENRSQLKNPSKRLSGRTHDHGIWGPKLCFVPISIRELNLDEILPYYTAECNVKYK